MDIVEFRDYCILKPGVTEEFPFDNQTLVFKVMGKIFTICGVDDFDDINLKCDPEWALELRAEYPQIRPGYHMNKKHWNTVTTSAFHNAPLLRKMIDHSYDLVVSKLPKAKRDELKKGPVS
ncbi:MAG: MmcQ/YjbR family DNA-binding protein [Bacteroidia bacterium]|nr:MmcQ/YjbR family DNA-binding protein [Bacteroidia bacterium]